MEKLLVLGAGEFQLPLIEYAKNAGIFVIAITPDGDYPGIEVADKVYFHDATDCEYALLVGKTENINGVISDQSEIMVKPVAYVAENLGLIGNGYDTACLYTNKHLMRKRGKELNLPTIRSETVSSIAEAERFFLTVRTKAIIKPVDNCSSRGVSIISDVEELRNKWEEAKEYSESGDIIIEEYVTGPQFEVDSIAYEGNVKPLMYADLIEFNLPDVFSSSMRLYPSVAVEETVSKLLDYNLKINQGFGMKIGVSHNEYVQDSESGEIYLIEAALRGGGSYIGSHIARLQTELDTAEFLVNAALGNLSKIPEFRMNCCHAGYRTFYLPVGEIIKVEGLDEVSSLEFVDKVRFNNIEVGRMTRVPKDKDQRHEVVLYASSREELLSRMELIRTMINIEVMTETGIEYPIWE